MQKDSSPFQNIGILFSAFVYNNKFFPARRKLFSVLYKYRIKRRSVILFEKSLALYYYFNMKGGNSL